MFPDEENSKPNTCINIFRRYTSALQGWLEGGHRDRQMYCEAIDLYMEFDLETFKLCMGLVQEKGLKLTLQPLLANFRVMRQPIFWNRLSNMDELSRNRCESPPENQNFGKIFG